MQILGDGLAGLLLARRLLHDGVRVTVYGDGKTNTPAQGLMHLFAGRTFRRSSLELEAFERAVEFWRAEPLAREYPVLRQVEPGDRLARSLAEASLPESLRPRRREDGKLEYGPGFSIASKRLESQLLALLGERYSQGRFEVESLAGPRVLALGTGAASLLPDIAWDISHGRTVEVTTGAALETIQIGKGIHLVPSDPGCAVIGGRSSPNQSRGDERELGEMLTGLRLEEKTSWYGFRCTPARDRRPILGWLEDGESFVFAGFGSRALFWLPLCADIAAGALRKRGPVPDELNWRRLLNSPRAESGLTL